MNTKYNTTIHIRTHPARYLDGLPQEPIQMAAAI